MLTPELTMVALSAMLGLIQILAASHAASLQRGYRWTGSARDEPARPLTGVAGRLGRALNNFSETFPLFAAAALAVHVAGRNSDLSASGASCYFWARVAYVPVYALGLPVLRSVIWNVAFAGIVMLLISLLQG